MSLIKVCLYGRFLTSFLMDFIHRRIPLDYCLAKQFNVLEKLLFSIAHFEFKSAQRTSQQPAYKSIG